MKSPLFVFQVLVPQYSLKKIYTFFSLRQIKLMNRDWNSHVNVNECVMGWWEWKGCLSFPYKDKWLPLSKVYYFFKSSNREIISWRCFPPPFLLIHFCELGLDFYVAHDKLVSWGIALTNNQDTCIQLSDPEKHVSKYQLPVGNSYYQFEITVFVL